MNENNQNNPVEDNTEDYNLISKEDEKSSLVLNDSDFGLTDEFDFDTEEVKSKKTFYIVSGIIAGLLLIISIIVVIVATGEDNYIDKLTVYSDGIIISDYADVPRNDVSSFLANKGYGDDEYIVDDKLTSVNVNNKVEGEDVTIYLLKNKSITVTYYNDAKDIDWQARKVDVYQYELPKVLEELDIVISDNSIIYVDNVKVSDINLETIREGSEIRVVEDTTFEEVVEETIPYSIEYKDDPTLMEGETKIQTPGVNGVKKITYKVYYSNGEEINREVILTEVSQAPVTEIVLRGTYKKEDNNQPDETGTPGDTEESN